MANLTEALLNRPGVQHVPYVVVKRADGSLALRHPDEVKPVPGQTAPPTGAK